MTFATTFGISLILSIKILLFGLISVKKESSEEAIEEKELIREVKNGNKLAFNILMSRYQKRIYHLARKIVINHSDADDVVQETFFKAYMNISSFSEEYKFYTWLYRIAVNTSLTLIKKRKRRGLSFDELSKEEHIQFASNEETDRSSQDSEIKNIVKEALKKLSPPLRSVFVLRTSEEMSYKEIAKTLNISVGTVMSRLNRARNNLQKYLRETGSIESI